ncbi:hypothetical protein ACN077_24850 [Clostridium chromiireducens]|uniref:hypothetical protein n=1 Tax=Clostridium chromiireducens TaxID=225345 RepID=UPI003AF52B1E
MSELFKYKAINQFKIKYEKLVKKSFEDYLLSLYSDLENIRDLEKRELIMKNICSNVKRTKTRWVNKILAAKNNKYIKDIEFAEIQYKKVLSKQISVEKFKSYFDAETLDEYKEKCLSPLNEWKSSTDSLLSDFPYIDTFSKSSIDSAFKNDIFVQFSLFCYEEESNMNNTTKIPSILSQIPVDTTSRTYFLTNEQKKELDKCTDISEPSTIDRYIMIGEDEQNELLLQLEQKTYLQIKSGGNSEKVLDLLTQIALVKSVKYLNRLDVKIISYYYTHFHKIVLGEPIVKSIYQITLDLGLANTIKNYDAIESSIAKLGSMTLSYNIEGNSINGIFLESSIYESNGIRMAKVYLGSILKELILKKSTLEYDGVIFNSLGPDAQQLAIWLQKRRYKCAITNTPYNEIISLSKLATAIYWNTKRIDRKRDRLIVALNELENNHIVVAASLYDKKNISFEVKYIPLSSNELLKLQTYPSDTKEIEYINESN